MKEREKMQIFIVLLGIVSLITLITKFKFDPFLSILAVSLILGLFLGQTPSAATNSVITGTGQLLGELSLVLGLGAMLGALFESSGAAATIAHTLTRQFGVRGVQWAVLAAGLCISFSLFFDVAFILLIPITMTLATQVNVSKLWLGMPATIGILTVHVIFPPQPGPIALINEFQLSTATVVILGLVVALPTAIIGGIFFTKLLFKKKLIIQRTDINNNTSITTITSNSTIKFNQALGLLLLPVVLITIPAFVMKITTIPSIIWTLQLVSSPVIALLITLLLAINLLGIRQGQTMAQISPLLSGSVTTIAAVLLINGSAGGLKQVLTDVGVTKQITSIAVQAHISPLFAGFLIAAFLRMTLGSSTVAAITSAGIVKPMLIGLNYPPELVMLSISVGSIFCSHVNDPGFWLFKQYMGLDIKTVFKTWTLATIVTALVGFIIVLILAFLFNLLH